MDNNYWKEKYADYHSRSESRIAELEEEKEEFRTAYNAILEQCKKEQAENERLKKVAFQSQNAAIDIKQQAEKYEERIKVLENDLVDWQDAYKELDEEHDKFQKAYQDDHCDLLKYKQVLQKIKKYIAKICKEECGYVQKKRCPDCDCRYGAILDLITKAEEEDETKNT